MTSCSLHALCRTVLSFKPRRLFRLRLTTRLLDAQGGEIRWN